MSDKPKTASDLVSEVLGAQAPGASAGAPGATGVPSVVQDTAAEELVELYFVLEEPAERDNVFDRLLEIQSPVVNEFLTSMMVNDEDEFMRFSAAAEMARRGDDTALSMLEKEIREPTDAGLFALAVDVLIEMRGAAIYDLLQAIWRNPSYDTDERIEALLGMEEADAARAMDDFVGYVNAQRDMAALADDQLEAVLASFVRCGHSAAKPALEALHARILASKDIDEDERINLAGMVREGLDLLEVT